MTAGLRVCTATSVGPGRYDPPSYSCTAASTSARSQSFISSISESSSASLYVDGLVLLEDTRAHQQVLGRFPDVGAQVADPLRVVGRHSS